ncbi:MAG: DHA2 family efflux MFS transporter permease subunit [Sarcina sp.]
MTDEFKVNPISGKWLIASVLLLGTFIAFLNETALTTALPTIIRELNLTASNGQWLTTAFMLTSGIMVPMTAFLIKRFSTRGLFFVSMGLFTIGTVIGSIAPSFDILLIARIIQAMGAGIILPLMQTVFLFIFPAKERGTAMGIMGIVISFAPAIGPTFAGWLVEHYRWQDLFYITLPIAIIDLVLGYFLLKNVKKSEKASIDILSVVTSTIGFGGLLYGFSNAGSYGWGSSKFLIPTIVGVLGLIIFTYRQFTMKNPFLNLRVFKNKTFSFATLIVLIVFAGFLSTEVILPLYVQTARGFTSFESGLLLLPGALILGVMSPITGRLFDKFGGRLLVLLGLLLVTAGTLTFMFLTATTSLVFISTMYAIRLLGIALFMMPLTTISLNALEQQFYSHGIAASTTLRQVAASIGTAILITVMVNGAKYSNIKNPESAMIHGMNISFGIASLFTLIALILAFFVLGKEKKTT